MRKIKRKKRTVDQLEEDDREWLQDKEKEAVSLKKQIDAKNNKIKETDAELQEMEGQIKEWSFPGYQFINDIRSQRNRTVNKFDELDEKIYQNRKELLELFTEYETKLTACKDDFTEVHQGFDNVK